MAAGTWSIPERLRIAGYGSYREYLASAHWASVKRRFGGSKTCACCKRKGSTEVHHRTYKRLGNERRSDVVVLCRDCHREVHRRVAASKMSCPGQALYKITKRVMREHHKRGAAP